MGLKDVRVQSLLSSASNRLFALASNNDEVGAFAKW
jgi:hypothetical protein